MAIELIELDLIEANPWQTRQMPDLGHITELAQSIHLNSLLQPPVGRMMGASGRVQLAFGHNRLAAYRMLHEQYGEAYARIPVELRNQLTDEQMAVLAWTENSERKDLTAIEQAEAIQHAMDAFSWSQEKVGEKFGLARATVANKIRLLKLPGHLTQAIREGKLSERQASALLGLFEVAAPMRAQAEQFGAVETQPSRIQADALGGASSDEIRRRVEKLVVNFTPKAQVKQPSAVSSQPSASQPAWMEQASPPAPLHQMERGGETLAVQTPESQAVAPAAKEGEDGEEADQEEGTAAVSAAAPAEVAAQEPARAAAQPAQPAQSPAQAAPVLQLTPLSWEKSTIQVTITIFPDAGSADGRMAAVAVQANKGTPAMIMTRESRLMLDGSPAGDMLAALRQKMEAGQ